MGVSNSVVSAEQIINALVIFPRSLFCYSIQGIFISFTNLKIRLNEGRESFLVQSFTKILGLLVLKSLHSLTGP